jgi:hypothetical protein
MPLNVASVTFFWILSFGHSKMADVQTSAKLAPVNVGPRKLNTGSHGNHIPNVEVEWLTLLRIREIPGSNFGSEIGYADWFFRGFYQLFQVNAGIIH